MSKPVFRLTENEEQIMETLWREAKPLSRSEVINLTVDKTWKDSSIHILLNQLLEKDAINVDGFVKTGKSFGRTYSPSVTKDEFDMMQLKLEYNKLQPKKSTAASFISYLVESESFSNEELNQLIDILNSKKDK